MLFSAFAIILVWGDLLFLTILDAQGCVRCFQQRPFGSSLGERTALPGPLAYGIVV